MEEGIPRTDINSAPDVDRAVFRVHMRSTSDVDHAAIENYCLRGGREVGFVGMGWGCHDEYRSSIAWPEYEEIKISSGEGVNGSVRKLHDLPLGSLIWTRSIDGNFWLGEVVGDWEYSADDIARSLDLFNRRRCDWRKAGLEDVVPGKIVNNFRAPITLNPITDSSAAKYSNRLFRELFEMQRVATQLSPGEIISSFLGAQDLEDLVAVYLQDLYNLVLVARGRSTARYEYVLRHRETGRKSVCSVKSGWDQIDFDELPDGINEDVFTYAMRGTAPEVSRPGLTQITTSELADFMVSRRAILPDRVSGWLDRGSV